MVDIVIPCFNDMGNLQGTIRSVLCQNIPSQEELRIILVDDGSTEGAVALDSIDTTIVTVIRHEHNRGLAAARNTGARNGDSGTILFLDADCELLSDQAISSHLYTLSNHDVSVGGVGAASNCFWGRYQNDVADRRFQLLEKGMVFEGGTAANCAISRRVFEKLGGFDERYTKYGFEDKDFFLRLRELNARVGICKSAMARHDANISLLAICNKLKTAGQYTSVIFMESYLEDYKHMSYAKVDARLHGKMFAVIMSLSWFVLDHSKKWLNWMLNNRVIPYSIAKKCVKLTSAIAYSYGTILSSQPIKRRDHHQ